MSTVVLSPRHGCEVRGFEAGGLLAPMVDEVPWRDRAVVVLVRLAVKTHPLSLDAHGWVAHVEIGYVPQFH